MQAHYSRRTYDYRIQEAICETGDRDLFPELNIPRSRASSAGQALATASAATIRSWTHRGVPDVVTSDPSARDRADLLAEVHRYQQRTALLGAIVGLLLAMLRAAKVQLDYERLPEGESKKVLLRAIERAGKVLPLHVALRIVQLSPSRYHSWCRITEGCELDDQSSCPRVVPTRLTPSEVETMQAMVESDDHRHMSLRALALHAQRIGKIFASPSTWYRLVREAGWRRPRKRLHPAKPKIGIRACAPGEFLHLDVTIIRLLDGTKAYLHAVIDNFSRRILSWTLEDRLGSGGTCWSTSSLCTVQPCNGSTCRILRDAAVQLRDRFEETTVVADSGSENVNGEVDQLLRDEELTRVLAQVEVTFSNSMIEAFFRSLKHAWLYLHTLDSFTALARLVEFYVIAHNEAMPHSAFEGQTPDEMYFGTGGGFPAELTAARENAREERMKANRSSGCGVCVPDTNSKALQLRRPRPRML